MHSDDFGQPGGILTEYSSTAQVLSVPSEYSNNTRMIKKTSAEFLHITNLYTIPVELLYHVRVIIVGIVFAYHL